MNLFAVKEESKKINKIFLSVKYIADTSGQTIESTQETRNRLQSTTKLKSKRPKYYCYT